MRRHVALLTSAVLRFTGHGFTLPAGVGTLSNQARAAAAVRLSPRFASTDPDATASELERLRRENAELKAELDHARRASPMQKFRDRLLHPFGGTHRDDDDARADARRGEELDLFRSPRRLFEDLDESFGALSKPLFSDDNFFALDKRAFRGATDDIGRVKKAVVEALETDGHADVELAAPPLSQSFSSSTINGKTTKVVALALRVTMDGKTALVRVKASIDERDDVSIDSLYVDEDQVARAGSSAAAAASRTAAGSGGLVIDI